MREQLSAQGTNTWKDLGMELVGFGSNDALDVIEHNNRDVTECCSAMFKLWLRRNPTASWRKLIQALRNMLLNYLATQIESKLQTAVVEPSPGLLSIHHVQPKAWSFIVSYFIDHLQAEEWSSAKLERLPITQLC